MAHIELEARPLIFNVVKSLCLSDTVGGLSIPSLPSVQESKSLDSNIAEVYAVQEARNFVVENK